MPLFSIAKVFFWLIFFIAQSTVFFKIISSKTNKCDVLLTSWPFLGLETSKKLYIKSLARIKPKSNYALTMHSYTYGVTKGHSSGSI